MPSFKVIPDREPYAITNLAMQEAVRQLFDGCVMTQQFTAGQMLLATATDTLETLNAGTSGQFLRINATSGLPAWETFSAPAPPPVDLLDGVRHQDTATATVVAGDLIFGNGTPVWDRLPVGANGQFLSIAAGLPVWVAAPAAAPGGNNQNIQFNQAGAFGGQDDLAWDEVRRVTIGGTSGEGYLRLGSGAAISTFPTGGRILDFGDSVNADYGTAALTGAFLRADGTGDLASTHFLMGIGSTYKWLQFGQQDWRWHWGDSNTAIYEWGNAGFALFRSVSGNSTISFNTGTGEIDLDKTSGNNRRIIIDCNHTATAPSVAETRLTIEGAHVGTNEEWRITATGSSASVQSYLKIRAEGRIEIVPQGDLAIPNADEGVVIFPQAALANTNTSELLKFNGRTSGNLAVNIIGGVSDHAIIRIDTEIRASGATNIFTGIWMDIIEYLGTVPTTEYNLARWKYNSVDVFLVDAAGDVKPRAVDYTWPVASVAGVLNDDGLGALAWTQGADVGVLVDTTGGTADNTVVAIAGTGDDANINNNFADLVDQINAIRSVLQSTRVMA